METMVVVCNNMCRNNGCGGFTNHGFDACMHAGELLHVDIHTFLRDLWYKTAASSVLNDAWQGKASSCSMLKQTNVIMYGSYHGTSACYETSDATII